MTRKFLTALLAFGLLAGTAFADGLPKRGKIYADETPVATPFAWSGLYLGMGLGWGHTLGDTEISYHGDHSIKSFGADGWRVPIIGGLDYHFKGTPFVIGAFGTWNPDGWGDSKFSANVLNTEVSANLALTYSAGVRVGLIMANQTMIYTGYKHQWADLTVDVGGNSQIKGIKGHGAIVGMEMPLNIVGSPIQATFSLEGSYTRFEKAEFDFGCPEVVTRPDDLAVMGFLKIRTGVLSGN